MLSGRRAGGGQSASPLWRITGCVHGGRRWRSGLAWIRHAARPPARVASRRRHAWRQSVADAADPLRSQPGNNYRCHHAFRGAREIRDSVTALLAVAVATTVM